ncbi:P1 family peptidase [Pimelobacter sp. 30-1]|uniref:DmpA family aminopeptidase n=1 Tax=Pimelobacter sp. 30-1 TaxID=2004991 RepID=UPI001C05ACE3|nr:P1 family peptidase [Pimelobacter sp. 30-1]MBU2697916.1 aminopeptidase [Pimelobacter sp. 30-1]
MPRDAHRPRARARDLVDLPGEPGPHNAITDVPGVTVGVETLVQGDDVRTGVTAILPRGREGVGEPCAAGWYSLNGNGELTGTTWIEESGALTMPVTLSNTHAVGACHTGVVAWVNEVHPRLASAWLLPVCGETWDGYLNDINGGHVRPEHARAALDAATGGPVPEGSVGGGTGMNCYAFKGGTGTASRRVRFGEATYTVGALVQANFGSREELVVAGVPVGRSLREDNPMETTPWFERDLGAGGDRVPAGAGSVIVVVATDAPLLPHQCKALARRVPLGLARTGTAGGHFSGDIFLAFSTAPAPGLRSTMSPTPTELATQQLVPWGAIDPFLTAVVEAVEESVLNALVVNDEMVGRAGHRTPALPHDALRR